MNIKDPENITFVYSRPSEITSLLDPISKNTCLEKFNPKKVTNIESKIPYIIV